MRIRIRIRMRIRIRIRMRIRMRMTGKKGVCEGDVENRDRSRSPIPKLVGDLRPIIAIYE
jgi:hypothetical protein